jgi:hypothetical protein
MTLIGPHFNQHKTCVSGTVCDVSGITGVKLADGDRTMVLRYCDTDLYVARFINLGLSDDAKEEGSRLTWHEGGVLPITSPGGFYKMCWCATTQLCTRNGRNFRVDYGVFYVIGPVPLTQHRTCISGQNCTVNSIAGIGLMDGDKFMALGACGDPLTFVDRFPGGGISTPSIAGGSTYNWATYVTSSGGDYFLCWCSTHVNCDNSAAFNVETGLLTMIGPYNGIDRTCKSGLECGFAGIQGNYLADGDRLMIQHHCGITSNVVGWPDQGRSDQAIFGGTEYSWGQTSGGLHVTSAGGEYSMCWCSALVENCNVGSDFRTELGIMFLIGPATGQKKTCVTGQVCNIQSFDGYELQDGDRVLFSDSCMPLQSAFVPGFPNNGIFMASENGATFTYPFKVTASGGIYSMCWCPFEAPCQSPDNFQVDAGNLTLVGPHLHQKKTCVSSRPCGFDMYAGQSLSTNDQILVLDTCPLGPRTPPPGPPQHR